MTAQSSPTPCLIPVADEGRVVGYVALDSTVCGRARGGLRIAHDVTEEELIAAARSMTLKYGLLGLPQGGAKAGIIGDPEAPEEERRRLLLQFARAAGAMLESGRYVPDGDLGTSASDIRWMMAASGFRIPLRTWRENRSGEYTARSCLAAAEGALGLEGESLAGQRVAIEGFGKVGSALARLLEERGARVLAISTSHGAVYRPRGLEVERLHRRALEVGSRFVEGEAGAMARQELLELPVDVLFPCARFHSIHAGNAPRVLARAIVAGANDPVSPEAEAVLLERGILYPPDFLSNCGGVLGGTLEFAGVPLGRIRQLIESQVKEKTASLLRRAVREGVRPRELAEEEAMTRHGWVRRRAENPGLAHRLFGLGLSAYRHGWLPAVVVGRVAPRYLAKWSS